ncbi:DUF6497 family protein [Paenirhodobacter populi]|uniref:DUF6497 family protein n=1 Tax=Paenirhodobacter populi TaxID=2306993 RepID=UPI000FE370B8|nr:DUF6497 family protein [Sinirhodobacter populi]RWR08675.1 acetolactate synthase [Sinirhodobacter populi]
MKRVSGLGLAAALAGLLSVGMAKAQEVAAMDPATVPVPSGQEVHWVETLHDLQGPAGLTLRFRFVAPGLGTDSAVSPEQVEDDMQALCNDYALPRVSNTGPQPAQIVISLSSRAIPFGSADETVAQYFDAFSIVDGACVWELF